MIPVVIDQPQFAIRLASATFAFWLLGGSLVSWVRRDPFHPAALFSLFYGIEIPGKLLLSLFGIARLNSVEIAGTAYVVEGLILANIAGLLFVTPMLLVTANKRPNIGLDQDKNQALFTPTMWIAAFAALTIIYAGPEKISLLIRGDLNGLRDVTLEGEARAGSGAKELLNQIAMICLCLAAIQTAEKNSESRIFRHIIFSGIFLGLGLIILFISFSKAAALMPPLAYLVSANAYRMKHGVYFPGYTFLIIIIGTVLMIFLTGYFRGIGSYTTSNAQNEIFIAFVQFQYAFVGGDLFVIVISRLHDFWFGDMKLQPFLELVTGVVPRFAWVAKPLVMGNFAVMARFLPEVYTGPAGEVVGFTLPGQLMAGGGLFGLVMMSIVLGVIWGAIYRRGHVKTSKFSILMLIFITANCFSISRTGAEILSPLFVFFILCCFVLASEQILDMLLRYSLRPEYSEL